MLYTPRMKNTAKYLVRRAQRFNDRGNPMGYFYLLNGFGFCRLSAFEGEAHDYRLAIDEIHNYQAKYPKKSVKEGYRQGFSFSIRLIHDMETLYNVVNYLDYEFEKQKNGTAAFRLDFEEILQELKAELKKKADILNLEYQHDDFDKKALEILEELERKSWERY